VLQPYYKEQDSLNNNLQLKVPTILNITPYKKKKKQKLKSPKYKENLNTGHTLWIPDQH